MSHVTHTGQALFSLVTKFCSSPHWEKTHGIIRTLYDSRLVGAGCSEVTEIHYNVSKSKEMHFRTKPYKTHYMMQGNQNVLPADRRQAVWGKKRLMEFLAALKKNPLCHSMSPSETVSGLSSLFGAVILQHHRALTCYTP